jgi:uncharacterized protein DUF4350
MKSPSSARRLITTLIGCAALCRAAAATPVVLFDEAHGERFLTGQHGPLDLADFAAQFTARHWSVRTTREPLGAQTLAAVDAIVMSGAFAPLAPEEIETLLQFLHRGGRLCVMLHIAPPVDALLYRLNVAISNGVIHERENVVNGEPLNFRVTPREAHPLWRDVDAFNIYGGWALRGLADNATVIATTSPRAWIDLNGNGVLDERDAVQSFGVVIAGHSGSGRFAIFGDDAMFQNQFLTGGNLKLAQNLVDWLAPTHSTARDEPMVLPKCCIASALPSCTDCGPRFSSTWTNAVEEAEALFGQSLEIPGGKRPEGFDTRDLKEAMALLAQLG